MLSRFHLTAERYGQTDGQTDGQHCYINIARQYVRCAYTANFYASARLDMQGAA